MEKEASYEKKCVLRNVLLCVFALECVLKVLFIATKYFFFNPLF